MRILPFLILISLSTACFSQELKIGNFSAGDLSGWKDKPYKGKTVYTLVQDEGRQVLRAYSKQAASGLIKKVKLEVKDYPILRWSWKVEHSLQKEDVKTKEGDDFAARVYVVFPRTFFWRMRAINYVWAAKMPKDSNAPSPYTSNSVIVAVESGNEKAGTWITEERNIYEDYRKYFGEEPPKLGGIAILTDTDDTKDEVTAWYGDISLLKAPSAAPVPQPTPSTQVPKQTPSLAPPVQQSAPSTPPASH